VLPNKVPQGDLSAQPGRCRDVGGEPGDQVGIHPPCAVVPTFVDAAHQPGGVTSRHASDDAGDSCLVGLHGL
jgi:hypothetical protein